VTQRTPWTESDAVDGAIELFYFSNPLMTAFDQVNPAQDALARSVLGNSVFELVNLHDDYHNNVYVKKCAPRVHDRAGAALSKYLLSFFSDIRRRIAEGEQFNMLSRRIGNHISAYSTLRDGGAQPVASVLISLQESEQVSQFLLCLLESGVDPVELAFNHSLQATLVAVTKKPLSFQQQNSLFPISTEEFSMLQDSFSSGSFLERDLYWFGIREHERQTAFERLGLLADLRYDERETFDALSKDWNGTLADLKRISVTLTRS